jgi:hypothetical protein
MTPHRSSFDPELEALLERGRTIPCVPDVVRARALTRARAIMAGAALTAYPPPAVRRRGLTLALAASVALVVGAAGAVAAWRGPSPQRPEPAPSRRAAARVAAAVPSRATPAVAASAVAAPELLPAKASHSARPLTVPESYAAELALLSRAQVAYAGQDFSSALTLVAEHGRRFPRGRLAEEREALRVRSLAKSGRADEARRAAAAFAERFPRSVMLPRLRAERL